MMITKISDRLVHLLNDFSRISNLSIYSLLKETGYYEIHDQISVQNIRDALVKYPECIDEWITYSEDKRSSSGWYIKKEEDGQHTVGFIGGNKHANYNEKYSDRIDACARFIKFEIDHIKNC